MDSNANSQDGRDYDLIIIGGGIYGCALLWEASHRGLKTLLLEKNDFCSASSANSLKTIHGGIRYLQQFNLKRVIESDREKVILNRIAPNLVRPLSCCIATDGSLTKNTLSYWFATTFFNLLSYVSPLGSGRFKDTFAPASVKKNLHLFNKSELNQPELSQLGLKQLELKQGKKNKTYMVWQDAQATNSEQLGLAFIRSALLKGSTAKNYSGVSDVTKSESGGYQVSSLSSVGESLTYTSTYVADCTSAGEFSKRQGLIGDSISRNYITGVNLVLSEQFSDYAFALPGFNQTLQKKGMLFFSPWKNSTLAGTWYFHKKDVADRSDINKQVISNCITDIQTALKSAGVSLATEKLREMIVDIHLGHLPGDANANTKKAPEKALINKAIIANDANYYCLQGNKYTTARLNAKKLIDKIAQSNSNISPSQSHKLVLTGAAPLSSDKQLSSDQKPHSLWSTLSDRYGDLAPEFDSFAKQSDESSALVPGSNSLYKIEVAYFSQQADVASLSDLLYRRINHNVNQAINTESIEWCANELANIKGWDESTLNKNISELVALEHIKQSYSTLRN